MNHPPAAHPLLITDFLYRARDMFGDKEIVDHVDGAEVFASAGCTGCHTLADAGTSGTIGPDLDALKPSYDAVHAQVTNGGGGMPAFKDTLSEQQINDVAAYVSDAAGK